MCFLCVTSFWFDDDHRRLHFSRGFCNYFVEMTTSETNREKEIGKEDKMYYEEKMKNFECPFTWEMSELKYMEMDYLLYDNKIIVPLMKLMRRIVHVYEYMKNKKDSQIVLEKLSECYNGIVEIQESAHPEISIEAVLFVLRSTKCFVFLHFKMETELKQILAETNNIDPSDKKQTSTVKACKSIAWSNYWQTPEAIKFIREAIKDNPNCDLWYFILGKMLRTKRRTAQFYAEPDAEEIESFEKAYDMMKNPFFGVYLGKAYNEQNKHDESMKIYKKVLPDLPQNDTLLLIIALGRIQMEDFHNAKYCLDKVANKSDSMYLHYKGLYHSKQGQYAESCPFFEDAIQSNNNLQADYNYIYVKQILERTEFDLSQHLLQMLDKYRNWSKDALQTITLHLAYTYFKKDRKIEESLKYFLKAIYMNPNSTRLKGLYRPVLFCTRPKKNIFAILSRDILPIVRRQPHRFDENTMQRALELEEYCNDHYRTY